MSAIVENTDVTNVVEGLQELAYRMGDNDYGFKESDIDNVDNIMEAIKELESERMKVHELLEKETIDASVLRHQLQFLPGQIAKQLQDAIDTARGSNAEEVNKLKNQLQGITDNITFLTEKHVVLEKENAILHPERDKVRRQHEEVISQLNQRMAEKASKQIVLNETRDKLRDTNQKIVELEEGIIQLRDDLIQERAEARMEKKRLKKAVHDTTIKTQEQREMNLTKKKELNTIQEQLTESESKLDAVRKNIRRYETSRSRLENQERALVAQLNRELKQNVDLRNKGLDIKKETALNQAEFDQKRSELEQNLLELDENIAKEDKKEVDMENQKIELKDDLVYALDQKKEDKRKVDELNDILQEAKEALAKKAEDCARMQEDTAAMEEQILSLDETHKVVVTQLNKQIEECREHLNKERKERMDLQLDRDDVQKEIDDYRQENQKYFNDMTKKINDNKARHDQLSRESNHLSRTIRKDDETITTLQRELSAARKNFNRMEKTLEDRISLLESEIAAMEKDIEKKQGYLETKTPIFESLEQKYEERTQDFEKMKKDIVVLKNKRMGLEESTKRTKKSIEKLSNPQLEYNAELKEKRKESLDQLKQQAADRKAIEEEIYTVGCKLRTVIEENNRFVEAIDAIETEIKGIHAEMDETEQLKEQLSELALENKATLSEGWDKDHAMDKEIQDRDLALSELIGDLLAKTEKRESKISGITSQLKDELYLLSTFLDNVSSRRPPESRVPSRPATKASTRSRDSKGKPKTADTIQPTRKKDPRDYMPLPISPAKSPRDPYATPLSANISLDETRNDLLTPYTPFKSKEQYSLPSSPMKTVHASNKPVLFKSDKEPLGPIRSASNSPSLPTTPRSGKKSVVIELPVPKKTDVTMSENDAIHVVANVNQSIN
ncbi:unnamed protein product [Owenia fusiformis]|uniref:Uncharacterized protein n=1 Tax=Owenia fusiformis TaxID=6347 RepID=A0A8J1U347_OWEFU|nr:unnamed protein product [Owenia fusiformis]